MWFLYKDDLRISCFRNNGEIDQMKNLKFVYNFENYVIFHIIDQIKDKGHCCVFLNRGSLLPLCFSTFRRNNYFLLYCLDTLKQLLLIYNKKAKTLLHQLGCMISYFNPLVLTDCLACACGCTVRPEDCTVHQYYQPQACMCMCKNWKLRNSCVSQVQYIAVQYSSKIQFCTVQYSTICSTVQNSTL